MTDLGHKEGWTSKNWCFQIVVLEKTLESPLDCKELKLVNPKGNQPWVFIGRIDAEAEAPVLRLPDSKSRFIGKDPNAGKDWVQEEETTDDQMIELHHQLNGHEFDQTLGDSEGQGSLVCCSSSGCKSWIWLSNWTTTMTFIYLIFIFLLIHNCSFRVNFY